MRDIKSRKSVKIRIKKSPPCENGGLEHHIFSGEEMRTPALGITVVQDAKREGLAVDEIQSWSDAAGKLQVGDMILSVNGCQTVTNRQLQRIKDLQRVGDTLFLQVRRQGQVLEIPVLLVDNDRYEQGNSEVVN